MKPNKKQEDELSLGKILSRLREEYWRSITEPEEKETRERVELFTFFLGEERYGLDLALSRHLLKIPRIVKLPQTPPYLLGVFNLRGEIVPALDLRRLFGIKLSPQTENSRLLVVEARGITIALYLDRIGDIVLEDLKNLQALSGEETGVPAQYIKGYFRAEVESGKESKMLIYLDLEQLLSSEKLVGFSR